MKKLYILFFTILISTASFGQLILTGVFDGPLTGGTPKAIEIYVQEDIADLSIYGLGTANNGKGTNGEEFTFPAVSASAGDFIYVATESAGFTAFFGFAPDYIESETAAINGDDAIELFKNGVVIDIFGDINIDGSGEAWDYVDGWAYRKDGTGPNGTDFVVTDWTYSGINALDDETTNASATTPFPIGTYSTASTEIEYTEVANLTALKEGIIGDYYEVTGEIIFTWSQASGNQKWAQDATAGICFYDPDGIITTTYNIGDGVTGIKGQLALYNGLYQLHPTENPGPASSTGNVIIPEIVTISELINDHSPYESKLVELQDVTFEDGNGTTVFEDYKNYNISETAAGPIAFSTYMLKETNYVGDLVPTGAQNLVVLVGYFNEVQVASRSLSDLTLSVVENQIEGFAMYPNPVANGKFSITSNSSFDKNVEIYSMLGKRLVSKTVKSNETIDISNLTTGFYMVRVEEEGKIATRKLLVK